MSYRFFASVRHELSDDAVPLAYHAARQQWHLPARFWATRFDAVQEDLCLPTAVVSLNTEAVDFSLYLALQ